MRYLHWFVTTISMLANEPIHKQERAVWFALHLYAIHGNCRNLFYFIVMYWGINLQEHRLSINDCIVANITLLYRYSIHYSKCYIKKHKKLTIKLTMCYTYSLRLAWQLFQDVDLLASHDSKQRIGILHRHLHGLV